MFNSKTINDYKNIHPGEKCLVCGLGPSLKSLKKQDYKGIITIGVNDIHGKGGFNPDYQCLSESTDRVFDEDHLNKKIRTLLQVNPKRAFFSVFDGDFKNVNPIKFELVDLRHSSIEETYNIGKNFAYRKITTAAISLAIWMGFKSIGIIGYDMTGERAVYPESDNLVTPKTRLIEMNKYCDIIYRYCLGQGIDIFNLSDVSLIKSFPKMGMKEFCKKKKRLGIH